MIQSVDNNFPHVPNSAYVHSSAVVIGNVTLGKNASVWPNAVLRGDLKNISIGENSNVQDGCVLHTGKFKLTVGDNVLIGHNVTMHSCDIGRCCMIGMGAVILDAAKVGEYCIIGAGSVIPPGSVVPAGSVVMGNPYKIARKTTQEDREYIFEHCANYVRRAKMYKKTAKIL